MSNRRLQIALFISLLIHALVLGGFSLVKVKKHKKPAKSMVVTYQKIITKQQKQLKSLAQGLKALEPQVAPPKKIELLMKDDKQPSFFEKKLRDISKFSNKMRMNKKANPQIEPRDIHRVIDIPMLKSNKITNPKYLSYNQSVRQKIRQRAYSHVDHPDFDSGEVYLTFVIASDGKLKDLKVIEQKTNANEYLKGVGLKSIRESSPFPPFPKDLTYPELTFNVIISFEFNE